MSDSNLIAGNPQSTLPTSSKQQDVFIDRATLQDASQIQNLVISAYTKYIERMGGREPAPMTQDYRAVIIEASASDSIFVLRASQTQKVLGSIQLSDLHPKDDAVMIHNVVVDPTAQGSGYCKQLMRFAEDTARAKGRGALTLFTNEKMYENLVLYPKLGFVETERKIQEGYHRVFFRKSLSSTAAS